MNIKKREALRSMIFSLITCGIYQIYWTYRIVKEYISFKDKEDKAVLEIILSIFFPFIGLFLTEKKFSEGCAAQGIEHKDNSVVYLVVSLLFVGIGACISLAVMQNELNKILTVIE